MIKRFGASAEVGFTICMDDADTKRLEPGASPPSDRIRALKRFHNAGIRTYVFMGPLIPGISDANNIVKKTYEWTDHCIIDRLNMKGNALKNMSTPSEDYYIPVKAKLSVMLKNKPHMFFFLIYRLTASFVLI